MTNPSETVSDRRRFLRALGYTAFALHVVPLAVACAAEDTAPADSLAIRSSSDSKLGDWAAHAHDLYVPLHWFRQPPAEGVSLETTSNFFHTHKVALTRDELTIVGQGGSIRVRDSLGVHDFVISLS